MPTAGEPCQTGLERTETQAFGQTVRVELVALVLLLAASADVAHDHTRSVGHQQVVQPLRLGSFLEGHLDPSAQPADQREQRSGLGRDSGVHHHPALLVTYAGHSGRLVDIQREILNRLFAHRSRSLRAFGGPLLYGSSRGRAFNMRWADEVGTSASAQGSEIAWLDTMFSET